MRVHLVSTSRADYRGLRAIARALQQDSSFTVELGVWPGPGGDAERIRRITLAIRDTIPVSSGNDFPGQADLLFLLGDRPELLPVAGAALERNLPIAHVHGGEETLGSVDNQVRHALTKLSHVHFVAHREYALRVLQMGEEEWRVHTVGAPALDNQLQPSATPEELRKKFGCDRPFLMVCYHPSVLGSPDILGDLNAIDGALRDLNMPVVWVGPNGDPGSDLVSQFAQKACWKAPYPIFYYQNLSPQDYVDLMSAAEVMLGNSSAGIVEAPSFKLPVLNVTSRQEGRIRGKNVIDVSTDRSMIVKAVKAALLLKDHLDGSSPYYQGGAGELIAKTLQSLPDKAELLRKKFVWR